MIRLSVTIYSEKQLLDMIELGVNVIRIADERYSYTGKGEYSFEKVKEINNRLKKKNIELQFKMERLIHESNLSAFKELLIKLFAEKIKVVFSDYAVYEIALQNNAVDLLVYDPYTLNTNFETINLVSKWGIDSVVLSRQLSIQSMLNTIQNTDAKIEIQVQGKVPLFFSKRKLITNYENYTDNKVDDNSKTYFLEEELRKDERYPIKEYSFGTTVFCSHEICMCKEIKSFIDYGVDLFSIENIIYSDKMLKKIVSVYKSINVLNNETLEKTSDKLAGLTNGNNDKLLHEEKVVI